MLKHHGEGEKERDGSWFSPRRLATPSREQQLPGECDRDPFYLLSAQDVELDAVELADSLEKGLFREIMTEFMVPLQVTSGLQRYNVLRSQDSLEHRLFSDDYTFLLYARTNVEGKRIDMFGYDPKDGGGQPFDPTRPAFTMTFNCDKTEWRLVQERCAHCQYSPKHLSCRCRGKQQVAYIRHFAKQLGNGLSNCMEVRIPGLHIDGSPMVWCPRLGKRDLASPTNSASAQDEATVFVTKCPSWNEEVQCLVLNFEGRTVTPSARNFQLAGLQEPEVVVCQYGQIGPTTFSLDFNGPLSLVQAFGTSLTTTFLT